MATDTARTVAHTPRRSGLAMTTVEPKGARHEGFEPPTARSVAWCSVSIWSDPDGSGLLTLDGPSIQTDRDGSCRIVWMFKRMIKPCDAASSPPDLGDHCGAGTRYSIW